MRRVGAIGVLLVLPAASACGVLLGASADPLDTSAQADSGSAFDAEDAEDARDAYADARALDARADADADADADAGAAQDAKPLSCGTAVNCVHYVFVAELLVRGDMEAASVTGNTGLERADKICQDAAASSAFAAVHDRAPNFKAWLSDSTTSADARIVVHGNGPYQLPSSANAVAANWNDLVDGMLSHAIDIDEGYQGVSGAVWTATGANGFATSPNCVDWSTFSAAEKGKIGAIGSVNGAWSDNGDQACNQYGRLYCIEDD